MIRQRQRQRSPRRKTHGEAPAFFRRTSLAKLLAAPGLVAFYDSNYGVSVSDAVDSWTPRVGTDVVTASGTDRPSYGSVVTRGKAGVTFNGTGQILKKTGSTLAALIDGSQAYSSLIVAKTAGGATRVVWSAGSLANAEYCAEGTSSGADYKARRTVALASTTNTGSVSPGTNPALLTTVYTGSAFSTWVNQAASLNAAANTRAPACDLFCIGGRFDTGSKNFLFDGTIWCVLLSTAQWSDERTALENAARAYWGI